MKLETVKDFTEAIKKNSVNNLALTKDEKVLKGFTILADVKNAGYHYVQGQTGPSKPAEELAELFLGVAAKNAVNLEII